MAVGVLPIRFMFMIFFCLCGLLLLSLYFIYDPILENAINCHHSKSITRPIVRNPDTLSHEEFIRQYVTLSERVERLLPGERLLNSIFYRHHLPNVTVKNRTLIAVVTTEKYLHTRANTIHATWAQDVKPHSKLYFFVGEDCNISSPELRALPIIKMKGIQDNVYPPQKKVFAVLEYIYVHFGQNFKWFVRADDDIYMRMDKFDQFLDKLEWTEMLYIGRPGLGKSKDRKRLKLLSHENYCMGGPGIVFSAVTLAALYPNLKRCLSAVEWYNQDIDHEVGWYNEDVELGRCVSRTIGISCLTKFSMEYFYHDYTSRALDPNILWTDPIFRNIITLHPIKNPDNILAIHYFYKAIEYRALSTDLDNRFSGLKSLCQRTPENILFPDTVNISCSTVPSIR